VACRVADGVRWVEVDDGVVIFNPETATFIDLDEQGAELWLTMSESGWDDHTLVRHLVATFDSDEERASYVVANFVEDMARLGVLKREEG
jgi:Coenzyme PQQ synthesis protein D (PqqD)